MLEFSGMTKETDMQTVYEIGFHLVPRLTEDEVPSHVDEIKSVLDKAGAEIISEEFPTLIDLAYAISTTVSGQKEEFDTAYFGWIKFEADPAVIDDTDSAVREMQNVLRFIIVKTLREDTVIRSSEEETGEETGEDAETKDVTADTDLEDNKESAASKEETKETDDKKIDDAIDSLVSETR